MGAGKRCLAGAGQGRAWLPPEHLLQRQGEPQHEGSCEPIDTHSGSGDSGSGESGSEESSSMGIASVMSTLLSLSMMTCSTSIWR